MNTSPCRVMTSKQRFYNSLTGNGNCVDLQQFENKINGHVIHMCVCVFLSIRRECVPKYVRQNDLFKGKPGVFLRVRTEFLHYFITSGRPGFDSLQGLRIFFFATASRPALGPIQPPIRWVPGVLSSGVKRPRREAYPSSPINAKVKNIRKNTSTPQIRLHGVVLS
jgi:hypothetical protein